MHSVREQSIHLIKIPRTHSKNSQIIFKKHFLMCYVILLSILLGSYLLIITINHKWMQSNYRNLQSVYIDRKTKSHKIGKPDSPIVSQLNKFYEPLIEVTTQISTEK